MIYFAYGSNTNPKVMLSRIPEAQFYMANAMLRV